MAITKGNVLSIYLGSPGTVVAHSTSHSMEVNKETIDVTSKDSAGWKEMLSGLKSGSMSGEAFFDEAATYGFDDLYAAFIAATEVAIRFSTEVTGDKYYSGNAIITSLSREAGNEEAMTISYSLEITGALAEQTVA